MRVIIVIPCYNEADRLDVPAFLSAMLANGELWFQFVDDGSTDATAERLGPLLAPAHRASLLRLPNNVGKAEAVRRGVMSAFSVGSSAPFAVGYWDADLATPLSAIQEFSRELERNEETIAVIGSRVRLMGRRIERRLGRHYAGRIFASLASLTLGFPVYDTQCGAKLFRVNDDVRRIFEVSFATNWIFDVELLARIAAAYGKDIGSKGVVVEYPLTEWVDVAGSKVRPSHLPQMLADLWKLKRTYG